MKSRRAAMADILVWSDRVCTLAGHYHMVLVVNLARRSKTDTAHHHTSDSIFRSHHKVRLRKVRCRHGEFGYSVVCQLSSLGRTTEYCCPTGQVMR
jgi:hypothetical protein